MIVPSHVAKPAATAAEERPAWGWIEVFVAIQYLSTALLFLPGAQSFRFAIRALPYVTSLGTLALIGLKSPPKKKLRTDRGIRQDRTKNSLTNDTAKAEGDPPPCRKLLLAALLLLVVGLAHPLTEFPSGPAQVVFQLCIAAPLFWAWKMVKTTAHLNRLVWLVFFTNALSVIVGLLQVYHPESFMPPEFSRVALSLNPTRVEEMSYIGSDGKTIIRPPGLSDVPGGASVAGMTVGFLGIVLASQPRNKIWQRLVCLALAGAGVCVLYLTQVRSLLLMMFVAFIAMCFLLWKQRRTAQLLLIGTLGAALVIGAFTWAISIGGKAVADRFLGLADEGPVASFQKNRGIFLEWTLGELLSRYPLGAGVGRWGMIRVYFPSKELLPSDTPWVEIQLTGWLLDGGVLMWVLYGGAIIAAMFACYRVVVRHTNSTLSYLGGVIFCLELFIVGQSFATAVFNTQLGIQFWLLVAALHGVAARTPLPLTNPQPAKAHYRRQPRFPRAAA
jgi:hypothetical protein